MADLLDHDRIPQFGGEPAQVLQRATEIGVAVGLHGLLQRVGVDRDGISADLVQRGRQPRRERVTDLSQADIADQQHVGGEVADLETARGGVGGPVVVEHDAL